eukprot:9138459-Pyramimonas_sp.AAC.1
MWAPATARDCWAWISRPERRGGDAAEGRAQRDADVEAPGGLGLGLLSDPAEWSDGPGRGHRDSLRGK